MKHLQKTWLILYLLLPVFHVAGQVNINEYKIENDKISYKLIARNHKITKDVTALKTKEKTEENTAGLTTDAGFSFEVMWTSWRAPGKLHNAENPVVFTQKDFEIDKVDIQEAAGDKIMRVHMKPHYHLKVSIEYLLPKDAFYIRKKIIVKDEKSNKHFLQKMSPIDAYLPETEIDSLIKPGGFGQPVAFLSGRKGVFMALEYPAAGQIIEDAKDIRSTYQHIRCAQEIGQKIDAKGISSARAVIGLTPDKRLRWWFYQYMDDIRFPIKKPYTLYNSWYDLRSPAFKNIPKENIMNETNIMRIIDLIQKNMTDKYGIHLDAFVLDDGWDVYESDWVTRKETFPNGMKPISDRLKQMNTGLGIWFGPTGGYSFRNRRIGWMMQHGYEVVGDTSKRHDAMLCLAGKNYSKLFRQRTVDFVKDEGVSFFKWDGIQFSCSEPDHGHPVGIYSRRAVMESVIDKCEAVRKINPDVYLNITSGTWLSPWWLQYANQIWMQGYDYGFANTPSISKRDAAMTYRDYVLWDDFQHHDNWFPIANLMTHGIIKGNLQKLGGEKEPLDKFTNNALLYFGRGVSMYELYISPDILSPEEWKAISQSMQWAKDRFDILKNSFYVGGNPAEKQAYAYVHFNKDKGIVAARNPFIEKQKLKIKLDKDLGLDQNSKDLIVEQVYPYHYIMDKTFNEGDSFEVELDGYETAVYEIYPRSEARWLLPANTKFRYKKIDDKTLEYTFYDTENPVILNPGTVRKIYRNRKKVKDLKSLFAEKAKPLKPVDSRLDIQNNTVSFDFQTPGNTSNIQLAVLYTNEDNTQKLPGFEIEKNDRLTFANEYKQKKKWIWKVYNVQPGKISGRIAFDKGTRLSGKNVKLYLIYDQKAPDTVRFTVKMKKKVPGRIMPPEIYEEGYIRRIVQIK